MMCVALARITSAKLKPFVDLALILVIAAVSPYYAHPEQ
jgi:hypothetical protein